MGYKPAIAQLNSHGDSELFAAIAEGMELLEENIQRLHDAAVTLSTNGGRASAEILGGLATEEAAKVLILLDAVRCPLDRLEDRRRTSSRWNNHIWKGIYAEACNGSLFHQSFGQLKEFVKNESALFYLDGPTGYDWIAPNHVTTEREQRMYVDYVAELTNRPGEQPWWSAPFESESTYEPSPCLRVVSMLSVAGATTAAGLAVVAEVWREFDPEDQTSVPELDSYIRLMLEEIKARQISNEEISAGHLANHQQQWPFPFWPIEGTALNKKDQFKEIQQERESGLEWVRSIESDRDPAPDVSHDKVRQLQDAFDIYARDLRRHQTAHALDTGNGLRVIPAGIPDYDEDQTPYKNLIHLWRALSDSEQVALIALALFTRGEVANWSYAHRHAHWIADNNNERYQIHLGRAWLRGLNRYENPPPPRL